MGSGRRKRPIIFVCNSIINNRLVSESIQSSSVENAAIAFQKQFGQKAERIDGPFYRKTKRYSKAPQKVQFASVSQVAIFDGWIVNALHLKEPEDSAFLLFDRRLDGEKAAKPKVSVVRIEELKPYNITKD